MVGFSTSLEHLDGHMVELKRDRVTQPDFVLELPGEGMPRRGEKTTNFGVLYVHFQIDYPAELNAQQKERIEKLID